MRDYTRTYFHGEWIRPSSGQILNVINAAANSRLDNTFAEITPNTITRA